MFIYPAEPDRVSEIKQFMYHIGANEAIVKRRCEESNLISPDHETGMLPLHYTTFLFSFTI